ncbi:hypothetical protein GGR50DRAFT_9202 [Xylaria sp. CBS 124048]|nr:hypothetical protein GGR50DRAFT_9202 [Xylaria sp. CBS 124048]
MMGFFRYAQHDEDDGLRSVERMSSIQEVTEYSNSRSGVVSRSNKSTSLMWPFHHRGPSEVPSTARSSRMGRFRSGTWNSRSFLRQFDDTASIDQTIVPDYVINFMRGETPETLAKKKELRQWKERTAILTPNRDTFSNNFIELGETNSMMGKSNNGGTERRGGLRWYLTGWRGGVAYNTFLASLMLIVGVVYLVTIVLRAQAFSAQVAIYSGNCATATNIKIGTNTVINVFSVVLLAGANYVFQVLVSPTRREISAAHERKRWLDIGIASLRNLRRVSVPRAILGTLILLVAIGAHVIYNAVVIFTPSPPQEQEQEQEAKCAVGVNSSMLIIAVILNAVLVLSMACILLTSCFDPLVTIGDVIRSFLQKPDETTAMSSLLSYADLQNDRWGTSHVTKRCEPRHHYWLEAPSLARWAATVLSWLAIGGPTAAAVARMGQASQAGIHAPFGAAVAETTFPFPIDTAMPNLALVIALSQLLLAILYLTTNALLTAYYQSQELALFALGPRSLRVSSDPIGTQTASLYLSLPRPVSWFLLATFAALGIVLSQAVFPVFLSSSSSSSSSSSPSFSNGGGQPAVAFNTRALLVLIGLLVVLLFSILVLGLRRTPAPALQSNNHNSHGEREGGGEGEREKEKEPRGNPLALAGGPNSALISARCHPSLSEGSIWLGPVAWGVVEEPTRTQPGRCAFTSGAVCAFDMGMEYA